MDFDWDKVISIRRGKSLDIESKELILPDDDTFYMIKTGYKAGYKSKKRRGRKPICIEEPFEGKF